MSGRSCSTSARSRRRSRSPAIAVIAERQRAYPGAVSLQHDRWKPGVNEARRSDVCPAATCRQPTVVRAQGDRIDPLVVRVSGDDVLRRVGLSRCQTSA